MRLLMFMPECQGQSRKRLLPEMLEMLGVYYFWLVSAV